MYIASSYQLVAISYSYRRPPSPQKISSINSQNKQRNSKSERTQKTKIRIVFYLDLSLFYPEVKMILWSIRTFWYKCSAEIKEKCKVCKKASFSQR